MEDKKKLDEIFEKGLGGLELNPPADAWVNIDQKLSNKKPKGLVLFWRVAAVAAALLFAFSAGFALRGWWEKPSYNEVGNFSSNGAESQWVNPKGNVGGSKADNPSNTDISATKAPTSLNNTAKTNTSSSIAQNNDALSNNANSQHAKGATSIDPAIATPASFVVGARPTQGLLYLAALRPCLPPVNVHLELRPVFNEEVVKVDSSAIVYYDSNTPKKKKTKMNALRVGMLAGPSFAFNSVEVKNDAKSNTATDNVGNEQIMNSYASGMSVNYQVNKAWRLSSGVFVNSWKQSSDNTLLALDPNSGNYNPSALGVTSVGNFNYSNAGQSTDLTLVEKGSITAGGNQFALLPKVEQQYQYVEVPLQIGVSLLETKRLTANAQIGASARFLSKTDVRLRYADGSEKSVDGLDPEKISYQLALNGSLGYKVAKNWAFEIQPTLLYGLTPVNQNPEVETYFHQFLVYAGLFYSF